MTTATAYQAPASDGHAAPAAPGLNLLDEAAQAITRGDIDRAKGLFNEAQVAGTYDPERLAKGREYLDELTGRAAQAAANNVPFNSSSRPAAAPRPAAAVNPAPPATTPARARPAPTAAPPRTRTPEPPGTPITGNNWPEIAARARAIAAEYVKTRPCGFDRKTGRWFHLNYLPWQSVAELLDRTTAGFWDTSVKVTSDSAGVAVTVTVHTPDGKTISRESIATVVYEEAAPAQSANQSAPARAKTSPLEKAERIAFKRAAALGIRLPESFDQPVYEDPNGRNSRSSAAGAKAWDKCDCGNSKKASFAVCCDCNEAAKNAA